MRERKENAWYEQKRVVVLGMAKSGAAAAKLLHRFGAHVVVNDRLPEEKCGDAAAELREKGIEVICGGHPEDIIHPGVDLVVKNPGIPYHAPPVKQALDLGIPVWTEVEIAYRISAAPIIGITGSNGKTTTTTMVGAMLEASGLPSRVAGNIGTVLAEVAAETKRDEWLVAELSSFQLMGTERFRPRIGALLNIYPAHLDYHGTMEEYVRAKMKLFANQRPDDIAVLNADSITLIQAADRISGTLYWFSREKEVERGMMIRERTVVFKDQAGKEHPLLPVSEIRLPGEHNLENVLAAALIARLAGASKEGIVQVLTSFQGVEHRLEYVDRVGSVTYYNDSKATNVNAALRALSSFEDPIVHVAGGLDRGNGFEELKPVYASGSVHALVCYGETSEKLKRTAGEAGLTRVYPVSDVEEAVKVAHRIAPEGSVVLLSPACASWDMYASFEERGRMFKKAVHKLKQGKLV